MALSINYNPSVLRTQRNLSNATNALNSALERMSTGFKVNRAADDAAGLYVATGLNTQIRGLTQAKKNAQDGISLLNTAAGALDNMKTILNRLRDLSVQASNGVYSDAARDSMQMEVDALTKQLYQIKNGTNFNGKTLFGEAEELIQTVTVRTGARSVFMNTPAVYDAEPAPVSTGPQGYVEPTSRLTESQAIAQGYKVIKTAADLDNVRNDLGGKYMLMGDIDLSGYASWTPIGEYDTAFKGTLDGNGYSVKNMTIKNGIGDIGLVGTVDNAEFRNLKITNANVSGNGRVAILAGTSKSNIKITNCFTQGTVTGTGSGTAGLIESIEGVGEISNCTADVKLSSDGYASGFVNRALGNISISNSITKGEISTTGEAGGLAGYVGEDSKISNCSSSMDITGTSTSGRIGGLIGRIERGEIKDASYSGNISSRSDYTGGIAGNLSNTNLINCLTTGNVTSTKGYAGGIVGIANGNNNSFTNCKMTGNITAEGGSVGGIAGETYDFELTNCSVSGNVYGGSYDTGGIAGRMYGDYNITNCFSTGNVTGKGHNTGGLFGCLLTNQSITNSWSSGKVEGFGENTGGLIGQSYSSATLSKCYSTGSVIGHNNYTGGIFGYSNNIIIQDSYSKASVLGDGGGTGGLAGGGNHFRIENSYFNGSITGKGINTGGIAGEIMGGSTIKNSFNMADVFGESDNTGGIAGRCYGGTTIQNSYQTGKVTGNGDYTGGLVGMFTSGSTLSDSYSTGNVVGKGEFVGGAVGANIISSNIKNIYSTGAVTGGANTGGILGHMDPSCSITDSFYDKDKAGTSTDIGLNEQTDPDKSKTKGLKSVEMSDVKNFVDAGWSSTDWDLSSAPPKLKNMPELPPKEGIRLQIGANSDDYSAIYVETKFELGAMKIDLSTTEKAAESIKTADKILEKINKKTSDFGAVLNRLDSILTSQTTQIENMTAAKSTIMDADIAEESAVFVKNQILQQTSSSLLSQSQKIHMNTILGLLGG